MNPTGTVLIGVCSCGGRRQALFPAASPHRERIVAAWKRLGLRVGEVSWDELRTWPTCADPGHAQPLQLDFCH